MILGAPGGGKTVLLLQLAKELIQQAKNPHPSVPSAFASGRGEEPIPVVFNLSSWAAERKPLAVWLVDELRQKYQVPKKIATAWVEGEKLLLLLDGLDEVAEQYRNECVDAINTFRRQYRMVDLALCSRSEEYDALTSKLDVRGAIALEPLSEPIIDAYLDRPELASLREVMADDKELQEMSQVPFLLNAMAYAYKGASAVSLEIPVLSTASDFQADNDELFTLWYMYEVASLARRKHLFDAWVKKRSGAMSIGEYPPSKIFKWLAWLAKNMRSFYQSTFYIEGLQIDWTDETNIPLSLIRIGNSIAYGVFFGLSLSYIVYELSLSTSIILIATLIGSIIGLIFGAKYYDGDTRFSIFNVLKVTFSLKQGFQYDSYEKQIVRPNQVIWEAIPKTLSIPFMFLSAGVLAIFFLPPQAHEGNSLTIYVFSLALVSIFALIMSLYLSVEGRILTVHFAIRIGLWRSGYAPWNYARFLDYCASAGLMRKVGGGYIFAHRYLMEYFAEKYGENQK